ncbi:MAG: endolytic transglycosylase MltG [Fimbriimonadaceae bacterium]|nr:endolytic transglycosylase MltG [Fimbriimonadaceae bacterium]
MAKKKPSRLKRLLKLALTLTIIVSAIAYWGYTQLQPTNSAKAFYMRYDNPKTLSAVLDNLQEKGVVRNATVADWYSRISKVPRQVKRGTYQVKPGSTIEEVYKTLQNPVRQMVRIPETYWASRVGPLLEEKGVASATEYAKLIKTPQAFQSEVGFPLPKTGTLEGYLYPDTYDLPPLLGARQTIIRQLKTFEEKVYKKLPPDTNLNRTLTLASMLQLEVKLDNERPIVAGVIENRVKQKMPLQIDATVLYGLQEWRRLTYDDYRNTDSPYNTYRIKGFPPGPICSPTIRNVTAALNPSSHPYLFYVALPEGKHLFSSTYKEHLKNIALRKAALAQQAKEAK